MHVSTNGFPQLKVLQLFELSEMIKLSIEKGAMPWLMQLQCSLSTRIFGIDKLPNLVEVKLMISMFSLFSLRALMNFQIHAWHWDNSW